MENDAWAKLAVADLMRRALKTLAAQLALQQLQALK